MSKISKTAKIVVVALVVLLLAAVAGKAIWMSMFAVNGNKVLANQERDDVLERRNYLLNRLQDKENIFKSMPAELPPQYKGEWALVTCSMTVTALANVSMLYSETQADNLQYMKSLISQCLSERYREFDTTAWKNSDAIKSLSTKEGHIGYLGHVNFMISAYKLAGGGDEFDKEFVEISGALIDKFRATDKLLLLETYPGQIYIPDNAVAVASLQNLVKIALASTGTENVRKLAPQSRWVARDWTANAMKEEWRDQSTGLLVFRVDAQGKVLTGSKGSGAGYNSFYLPYIDDALAQDQYGKFKSALFTKVGGVFGGIREFPPGASGESDVDSGPIVMGLSTSGTGFAVAGARYAKDAQTLNDLLFTSEFVGCTVRDQLQRHYLTSPLVGEAIMLAAKTHTVWEASDKQQRSRQVSIKWKQQHDGNKKL